ncbi:MAG: hypothetical protein HC899_03040 [Leptolyngbyaceae cyanobacterium SM1_4_3]|nr:hypothetical protein [Leptolyngbyaceae cyanobacterium SM1_4_3]
MRTNSPRFAFCGDRQPSSQELPWQGSAATASPIVARIQGLLVWKWELYRKLETMQAEV